MKPALLGITALVLAGLSLPLRADDLQKAQKQVNRITAMAVDETARGIVSMSLADTLKVDRRQLVRQRRNLRLNYGSLFIAHMVMARGASMADVVAGLRSGKTVWQLAAERQIELKQITSDAKKLNGKIEDNIYRHYLTTSTDKTRDELEKYSPAADWTSADTNVSDDEIAQARDIFVLWRNQAAPREDARLGIAEENAAYQDHARAGTPTRGASGAHQPAAGGLPTN